MFDEEIKRAAYDLAMISVIASVLDSIDWQHKEELRGDFTFKKMGVLFVRKYNRIYEDLNEMIGR